VLWFGILAGFPVVPAVGGGQQQGQFPYYPPEIRRLPNQNQADDINEQYVKMQHFEAINAERKKEMGDDSTQLLLLAKELNAEVDKAGNDSLSLTAIQKAEAIEKLAHDVKEKMKLTVGPG
jgi:hypothetical protein